MDPTDLIIIFKNRNMKIDYLSFLQRKIYNRYMTVQILCGGAFRSWPL
jgi:hypothetical protein